MARPRLVAPIEGASTGLIFCCVSLQMPDFAVGRLAFSSRFQSWSCSSDAIWLTSDAMADCTSSNLGNSFPTNMKTIARCFSSAANRFSMSGFSKRQASRKRRLTRLRSTARLNFFLLTVTMTCAATGSGRAVSKNRAITGKALAFPPLAKTRSEIFLDFRR